MSVKPQKGQKRSTVIKWARTTCMLLTKSFDRFVWRNFTGNICDSMSLKTYRLFQFVNDSVRFDPVPDAALMVYCQIRHSCYNHKHVDKMTITSPQNGVLSYSKIWLLRLSLCPVKFGMEPKLTFLSYWDVSGWNSRARKNVERELILSMGDWLDRSGFVIAVMSCEWQVVPLSCQKTRHHRRAIAAIGRGNQWIMSAWVV